jgi:protein-disulfide isomerase
MNRAQPGKSKRQMIRETREKRQRQQRIFLILGIAAAALLVAAFLIYPSIREANTPVGEIVSITPEARPLADGLTLGDPNAPVTVEVFEDFQCPACRDFTLNAEHLLVDNYVATGKIRYTFRHYPFLDDRSATRESDQSANASMCANEQGKFWEYHDMIFANWDGENQGAYSNKRLVAFAESLGLDMDAFNACFEDNKYKADIDSDLARGTQFGVTGTPSVFVNGEILSPGFVPSYDEIANAIETALVQGN